MNAPSLKNQQAADVTYVKAAPWQRLRLQTQRLAGQIGFKPLAGVLIVVLLATLWLDDASDKLAALRKNNASINSEVAKMKALAAMKTKIEQGLRDSIPQYEQTRLRGLNGPTLDGAAEAWKGEWAGVLQGQRIENAQLSIVPPTGKVTDTATLDAEFDAVPDQVLAVVDTVEKGDRLQRITRLELDAQPEGDKPHLHVKLRVEAHYFAPEGKGKPPAKLPVTKPAGNSDKKAKP
ncbi:hypothetical protein [Chitinimonas sp.]|uniref:hypothetical protein n=1 Tax=Chitinimonas sp. TaxID=1934313 RepID=UPI0035AE2579